MSSVVIGNLNGGSVRSEFLRSLMALILRERGSGDRLAGVILNTGGPTMGMRRNEVVTDFLTWPAEWLLFIDSDIVFPADLIDRLLAVASPTSIPIVGANVALVLGGGISPATYFWDGEGAARKLVARPPIDGEGPLVQVAATGAGCLLVHRGALEQMQKHHGGPVPWFGDLQNAESVCGEDIGFCLRAADAGIPIHVLGGVGVGHMKTRYLAEPVWTWPQSTADDARAIGALEH